MQKVLSFFFFIKEKHVIKIKNYLWDAVTTSANYF